MLDNSRVGLIVGDSVLLLSYRRCNLISTDNYRGVICIMHPLRSKAWEILIVLNDPSRKTAEM